MAKLSPRKVESKFMRYYIDNLVNAFNLCLDRKELGPFLKDILTDMEIRMLSKRLQIALMLYQGYDYQIITANVKVTNQTVARVSKILDYGEGGLYKMVKAIHEIDEKMRKRLEKGPKLSGQYNLAPLGAKYALELSARELLKVKRKHEVKKNVARRKDPKSK
ncbi:hypothetical protein KKB83_02440 [Patescibacteria group bacterium]|nr:hypothetical protein [Patescibacteria group bacterium]